MTNEHAGNRQAGCNGAEAELVARSGKLVRKTVLELQLERIA
jgi:hypothetical protein